MDLFLVPGNLNTERAVEMFFHSSSWNDGQNQFLWKTGFLYFCFKSNMWDFLMTKHVQK